MLRFGNAFIFETVFFVKRYQVFQIGYASER